jgi:hypothetical protein
MRKESSPCVAPFFCLIRLLWACHGDGDVPVLLRRLMTRAREIVPYDLARALEMEISGNADKSGDPGEPVLNRNPEFDPLENDFNLKYIVWTIVLF